MNVAKTYAQDGVYAERTIDGYSFTGAVPSTGPTLILPMALVFKLIGFSVWWGRFVVVVYGFLMLAALYALAATLLNRRFAIAVVTLAIFGWGNWIPLVFRNIMGEGPGLFFLFMGLWLWFRLVQLSALQLVGIGALFGLASITKTQYALFILPTLLCAWLLDIFWYKQHPWRYYVIPGIVAGIIFFGWTYYSYFMLGSDHRDPSEDFETLRSAGSNSYFQIDPSTNIYNVFRLAYNSAYSGYTITGILLGIILSLRRTQEGQRWSVLTLLLVGSMGLYVLSIGWVRVAVPAFIISTLFIAYLFNKLTDGFRIDWLGLRENIFNSQELSSKTITHLAAIGIFSSLILLPMTRSIYNVSISGSNSPYLVADYLNAHAEEDAIIETWDKELAVLTDHVYHHPPQIVETYRNAYEQHRGPPPGEKYDFRSYVEAEFVIIGGFSRHAEVYTAERLVGYKLVATFDDYDIYQRQEEEEND